MQPSNAYCAILVMHAGTRNEVMPLYAKVCIPILVISELSLISTVDSTRSSAKANAPIFRVLSGMTIPRSALHLQNAPSPMVTRLSDSSICCR